MKAIVQKTSGGPDTLDIGEVDIPIPKENEVLLKVKYSAVNRADINQVWTHVMSQEIIEGREVSTATWGH